MSNVFIYSLNDPETGHLRYIGKAVNPHDRFLNHLDESNRQRNHRACWIKSLKTRGLKPLQFIVAEVPETDWQFQEKKFIKRAKELGFDLVNGTDGGDGLSNPNEETRKKIGASNSLRIGALHPLFGKKRSVEFCKKLSAARTGQCVGDKNPMFGKPGTRLGKTWSHQQRERFLTSVRKNRLEKTQYGH